ncbi:MAG: primosomal protein N' [Bacteroidetes bacterium GWE2_29_8]|nr:MAG: primosomal protein N' [Bacteroidetes bacterium GWE2_29_8]OFY23394.1 MAG: primosomal protein N' [Bacteroidetes bacterium GWF2_29_10]
MTQLTLFADIILPIAAPIAYTYRVPLMLNDFVCIGKRVVVQFGKHKIYTGIILKIHTNPPKTGDAKYILSVTDDLPLVTEANLKFWQWISDYYLCTLGEVMSAALPSSLKLTSETKIVLNKYADQQDVVNLDDKEYLIWEGLSIKGELSIKNVADILGIINPMPYIKKLIEKNIINTVENIIDNYKPKTETIVELTEKYKSDQTLLKDLFENLEKKAPKQLSLIMNIIYNENRNKVSGNNINLQQLLKDSNSNQTALNTLKKKGIVETKIINVSRINQKDEKYKQIDFTLSEIQNTAYNQINEKFKEKDVVLLHGITGSGKTEIYIKLIEDTIKQNKQVLYLLPEIALTSQIIIRLKKYFGNDIGVYHSKFNENERLEIWHSVVNKENTKNAHFKFNKIILGARSAIFLPFDNLGLIIVDEEHDPSYKQNNPAPRYNARDTAIYLAKLYTAKTLLGSATPSIETYYNAKANKYAIVELSKRYNDVKLPEILIADIKEETESGTMKSHFTFKLFHHIQKALKAKEQIILFQNRRGYAPKLECDICNWVLHCRQCDVIMTYHKNTNQFKCHYCGYVTSPPLKCPECTSVELKLKGFGTEKLEDEMPTFFPEAKIGRMDLDSTRSKNSYHKILSDFDEKKIDILIGTQMISKGLDFDNVSLVGVLNADSMLAFPDFRANERSFQLITQVTGRSGRTKRGISIIQTKSPNNQIIQQIIKNDYINFYNNEILKRETYNYPPFYRLINITFKHKDINKLHKAASYLADNLKDALGNKRILGPEIPIISKINNEYIKCILVKIDKDISITKTKQLIVNYINNTLTINDYKPLRIFIDVDPY